MVLKDDLPLLRKLSLLSLVVGDVKLGQLVLIVILGVRVQVDLMRTCLALALEVAVQVVYQMIRVFQIVNAECLREGSVLCRLQMHRRPRNFRTSCGELLRLRLQDRIFQAAQEQILKMLLLLL